MEFRHQISRLGGNCLITTVILGSGLLLLLGYTVYYHKQVGKITHQLVDIQKVQTNKEIQLNSRNKTLIQLTNQMNQQLKINKQMHQDRERESQEFDRAINNIAHDLRTPLTVASGYNQYLAKHPGLPSEERQKFLEKILGQQKVAEEKLEELLTYNRLKEKEMTLNLSLVNLSQVLEKNLLNYFQAFQNQGIYLEITLTPNINVITDSQLFESVCQNILGNMLNHGQNSGRVSLTETTEQIILTVENEVAKPIKDINKLCERFYTEDLSRTTNNSGLGLYITKEMVTLLGGHLKLENVGHQFKITIILEKQP